MKVNSLLIKTTLAAAVASVSFGATAATVNLGVATPVVLANEIFGENSNTTIVQLPELTFTGSDVGTSTANSTIKLTLGGQAVFGEVYDDPAGWAAQNIVVNVGGTVLDGSNATVTAGGTRNDNQITIKVAAGLDLSNIEIGRAHV